MTDNSKFCFRPKKKNEFRLLSFRTCVYERGKYCRTLISLRIETPVIDNSNSAVRVRKSGRFSTVAVVAFSSPRSSQSYRAARFVFVGRAVVSFRSKLPFVRVRYGEGTPRDLSKRSDARARGRVRRDLSAKLRPVRSLGDYIHR